MIDVIYQDSERKEQAIAAAIENNAPVLLYGGDCLPFIRSLPQGPLFDLIVTSPPYNIGKMYEKGKLRSREEYIAWQEEVIYSLYRFSRSADRSAGRLGIMWITVPSSQSTWNWEGSLSGLGCACAIASSGRLDMASTVKKGSAAAMRWSYGHKIG